MLLIFIFVAINQALNLILVFGQISNSYLFNDTLWGKNMLKGSEEENNSDKQ